MFFVQVKVIFLNPIWFLLLDGPLIAHKISLVFPLPRNGTGLALGLEAVPVGLRIGVNFARSFVAYLFRHSPRKHL